MRLNELVGVKNIVKDVNHRNYLERDLLSHGFSPLGSGTKGTVYGHHKLPYVLKVFDKRDTYYLRYIKMCAGQNNPHLPKIVGRPVKVNDDLFAVRLKALRPWKEGNTPTDKAIRWIAYIDQVDWRSELAAEYSNEDRPFVEQYFKTWPQLPAALDLIFNFAKTLPNVQVDMFSENVMLDIDNNNCLVITDPVSP